MLRYMAGVASALLLVAAGVLWWKARATAESPIPRVPFALATRADAGAVTDDAPPPAASEKTREEKRFSRYDKDRDGKVSREEYLAARHKAFVKLDANGDGRLSFDEWAAKPLAKFADADADKTGALTPQEFATTRVVRKAAQAKCACRPEAPANSDDN